MPFRAQGGAGNCSLELVRENGTALRVLGVEEPDVPMMRSSLHWSISGTLDGVKTFSRAA